MKISIVKVSLVALACLHAVATTAQTDNGQKTKLSEIEHATQLVQSEFSPFDAALFRASVTALAHEREALLSELQRLKQKQSVAKRSAKGERIDSLKAKIGRIDCLIEVLQTRLASIHTERDTLRKSRSGKTG